MRVVFAGTPEVAIPSLSAILDAGHDVVAVLTQPDAKGKRGSTLIPSPVKEFALAQGLQVFTPERASARENVERIGALSADVAAVVAYGQILRPRLIESVTHGWVNLHFSLLPAWRGAAPVQRAIEAGDDVTGASTFLIEQGLDTGPIIGQLTETIRPRDTAGDLLDRLAIAGAPLLRDSIEALVNGTARPCEQDRDGVSHAAKLSRDDAVVRWDLPAHVIDRRIRACTPAPGAWTVLPDGTPARIGPVEVVDAPSTTPGLIISSGKDVLVGTGGRPVRLTWIQPAGKKQLVAADWLRGARLTPGAQLGES